MKRCPDCGYEIENDAAKFCPQCGVNLESKSSVKQFSFMNQGNNTNSQEKSSLEIEKYIRKWNWGAFLLFGFWGFFNGAWIEAIIVWVCSLIPHVGFLISLGVAIYFGIKGSEVSWKRKKWENFEQFKRAQKNWAIGGLIITGLAFIVGFIYGVGGGY